MRASYALPGVFAPVRIGGRWLLDGALVNPVPVSAARALDARLVIGVNTNADLFGRGTTIHSHGFDDDEEAIPARERGAQLARQAARGKAPAAQGIRTGRPARLPTVMIEAYSVMQDRITRARLAGDPADIMISPRLGTYRHVRFPPRRGSDPRWAPRRPSDRSKQIAQAMEALA